MSLFFATCAKNLEGLLREELLALGAQQVKETVAGVYFEGETELAYKVCLWSRLANHVLLQLAQFEAADADALYQAMQTIDWAEHLDVDGTLCIDVSGHHSGINNSLFIAQRAKDAIVDQFRDRTGRRPSVETFRPSISLNLHTDGILCTLNLNLSGESLHRRGYRLEAGRAPLKETLAAAILLRAGWLKQLALPHATLLDPMCGTGTILVEAALMAFDIAPGLQRDYFGFFGWQQHRPAMWQRLMEEAEQRKTVGLSRQNVTILGSDNHPHAISKSQENIARADLSDRISVSFVDCTELLKREDISPGLIVCNPPYGERMNTDDLASLNHLFKGFGEALKQHFVSWQLALFSGAPPECTKAIGIRSKKYYPFFNGLIPCRLFLFDIQPETFLRHETPEQRQSRQMGVLLEQGLSPNAEMFANRLMKNVKNLKNWVKREEVSCYRIYDADLPDYAVAVDFYEGKWLHVQEYQAPFEIDPKKAKQRLNEVLAVLHRELQIPANQIFLKVRQSQKGSAQYEKLEEQNQYYEITEGKAKLWVNFTDYLDTGIFLDHRILRQKAARASIGKRFLNLFAYTCSASVQAALMGAKAVTSVDLSNTYLEWGQHNFELNGLSILKHPFVQADCLQWLGLTNDFYDVIFLNPPTFSNSKRMNTTLDIQRDHVELIHLCMDRLSNEGILYFSCNQKNFKLNKMVLENYSLTNISHLTLPPDFERRANMHHVWEIRHHG